MARVKDELFFTLIKNFLLVYLPTQMKSSPNTVKAYRTAWNQFLKFISERKKVPLAKVTLEMLDYDSINEYLDWLTVEKEMKPATRNNRLAAIRAFFGYAAACKPEYMERCSHLSAIRTQKDDPFHKVDYMSEEAVKALMEAPDPSIPIERRDQFLMILLYDTGARIQELLDLRLCDLRLSGTPTVILHGKGGKVRTVPLMKETVAHVRNYLSIFHPALSEESKEYLFYVERKGVRNQMCDDTARLRLQKYVPRAREKCKDVPDNVHPHLWRHSRAMHLYQHGMDLTLVSQWLGHSQLETTLIYAHADTEHKRKAIEIAMSGFGSDSSKPVVYTVSDEEILKKLYGL